MAQVNMGPRYDEKTEQGKIPGFVEINTKLEREGTRGYFLRDIAEQVLVRQGILQEGEHVKWSTFRPDLWAHRTEGSLPDGREVEFWFLQQREFVWTQDGEDAPVEWDHTGWHNLDEVRHLPEKIKGQELIEYRFSGQFKKAS
jgi:hypothetical protein